MEGKESYTDVLIRLDERVKNLIDTNSTQHKEIIDSLISLKCHVNDENTKMDKRIIALEDKAIASEAVREDNEKRSKRNSKIIYYVVVPLVASVVGVLIYLLI